MNEILMAMVEEAAGNTVGTGIPLDQVISLPATTPEVENDAARLSKLLATDSTESVQTVSVVDSVPNGLRTIGDAILARLDAVGNSYIRNVERTHHLLESPPGNLQLRDLLKLQMEMSAISVEVELVGKGVSKAVQHVDQLSKLQ